MTLIGTWQVEFKKSNRLHFIRSVLVIMALLSNLSYRNFTGCLRKSEITGSGFKAIIIKVSL